MARFFVDLPLRLGTTVELPSACAHHALRVLRLRDGQEVTVFNGQGGEFHGRLLTTKNHSAAFISERFDPREAELRWRITVAQGLVSNEKMDWIVEKSIELGAFAIQALTMERSVTKLSGERAERRRQHWMALSYSASEQCGRNRVAAILPLTSLTQWLEMSPSDGMRLMLSPQASHPLQGVSAPPLGQDVFLLVGPEGGFSSDEAQAAQAAGFVPVCLGPRVLRCETAAAATLAMLTALWAA